MGKETEVKKTKYGKYFISGVRPDLQALRGNPVIAVIGGQGWTGSAAAGRYQDVILEGANQYDVHWIMTKPHGAYGAGKSKGWGEIFHGPHIHKAPELLMHLGTNPDDPMDLGAEVEMKMGPEMEVHTFNRSTVVYVPANFVHSPWRILKVTRPFIIVEINQEIKRTEKSRMDLVSEEERKRMIFNDVGYESDELVRHWPEGAGPSPKY
jgi:hypothetical protein